MHLKRWTWSVALLRKTGSKYRPLLGLTSSNNIQSVTSHFFKVILALYALEILLSDLTCDITTRSRNTRLFMLHMLNLSLNDFK